MNKAKKEVFDNVFKALNCCVSDPEGHRMCDECPYLEVQKNGGHCQNRMHIVVISLLQEYIPAKPVRAERGWRCAGCGAEVNMFSNEHCASCGRTIDWSDQRGYY